MNLSQRAIEAAARRYTKQRYGTDGLWEDCVPKVIDILTAALAVDGVCLVETPASCLSWPPFNVGARVTHTDRQENGTVTAIEDGCVVIEFDRPSPKGQKSVGKYDAAWFRMYPRGLIAAANDGEERR